MRKRAIGWLVLLASTQPHAWAWEPPHDVKAADALAAAELAFVGRVVRLREKQRRGTEALGIADVAVSVCLAGKRCEAEGTIEVAFTADTRGRDETERGGPATAASFALGAEYLFTFKKPGTASLPRFWTDMSQAYDIAFLVRRPAGRTGLELVTVVLGCPWPARSGPERVEVEQLRAWAARRAPR
jgi:hypothetical protein